MIIVRPLQRPDAINFVQDLDGTGNLVKSAKSKINSDLPSLITAYYEDNPSQYATWGFRNRRTSHAAEITWWGGLNYELNIECLKSAIYTGILEGRKRIEVFNERSRGLDAEGNMIFASVVKEALQDTYTLEGFHPHYTSELVDVDIYGHVWYFDGIPAPSENAVHNLVVNDRVEFYRKKNLELYAKDIDLYREDEKGITFAKRIEDAIDTVYSFSGTNVIAQPGWHGNELKSK